MLFRGNQDRSNTHRHAGKSGRQESRDGTPERQSRPAYGRNDDSLGLETLDQLTPPSPQTVGGFVKVTQCPLEGTIHGRIISVPAHLAVAGKDITVQALRVATAAERHQIKFRGHRTSDNRSQGSRYSDDQSQRAYYPRNEQLGPHQPRGGYTRSYQPTRGFQRSSYANQGARPYNDFGPRETKSYCTVDNERVNSATHRRHNKILGVVEYAASTAATQTSTMESDVM